MKTNLMILAAFLILGYSGFSSEDLIRKPKSGKGSVAFINAQSAVPAEEITKAIQKIRSELPFDIKQLKLDYTSPDAMLKSSGSQFALIIREDNAAPVILVAPEDHWAVVNVGRVTKPELARKEIIRAFALMCGGGGSQFSASILNVPSLSKLGTADETLPADFIDLCTAYMAANGVELPVYLSYEDACSEGWAPAPTSDVQKVIWDRVRAIPSKPLKITFDPAAQKGKVTK